MPTPLATPGTPKAKTSCAKFSRPNRRYLYSHFGDGTLESPNPTVTTTVSGVVENSVTHAPIAGATVYVPFETIGTTQSDGAFSESVGGIAGEPYTITAKAQGYAPSSSELSIPQNNQPESLTIYLAPYCATQPVIQSVTPIVAQPMQGIAITGTGFGNTPPQTVAVGDGSVDTLACNVTTPSLAIHDNVSGQDSWDAGQSTCSGGPDPIGINISSWSNTLIALNSFGSALGNASAPSRFNIAPGDSLTVTVSGPNNSCAATYNLQVAPATPATPSGSATISVPGNQAWTDTGISLNVGDTAVVSASGIVTMTTDGHIPPMSPAGFPPNCTAGEVYGSYSLPFPAAQLPCWSLIGKIGTNGSIFEVGTSLIFQAQADGEFYLGVNDDYLPDNSGSWTTAITVVPY